jgi:hypothetical protein
MITIPLQHRTVMNEAHKLFLQDLARVKAEFKCSKEQPSTSMQTVYIGCRVVYDNPFMDKVDGKPVMETEPTRETLLNICTQHGWTEASRT